MLSDWELWACAAEVLRQHGDRAPLHAAERLRVLIEAGDMAGIRTWRAIGRRLDSLMAEPERRH